MVTTGNLREPRFQGPPTPVPRGSTSHCLFSAGYCLFVDLRPCSGNRLRRGMSVRAFYAGRGEGQLTFGTHVAFASVLYLGGATLFGYPPDVVGWLLVAVASLGPDLDLPTSKVGRLLFWLSVPLELRFGHRTITHSVVGMLTVALIASPLWWVRPLYFWCVLGGTWSHVWIDMLNVRGADLFWPSPVRVVAPGNRNWRLEVGSGGNGVAVGAAAAGRGAVPAQSFGLSRCAARPSGSEATI